MFIVSMLFQIENIQGEAQQEKVIHAYLQMKLSFRNADKPHKLILLNQPGRSLIDFLKNMGL